MPHLNDALERAKEKDIRRFVAFVMTISILQLPTAWTAKKTCVQMPFVGTIAIRQVVIIGLSL